MKKILLLALIVFSIRTTTQAQQLQGQTRLDSMLAELPNAKEDSNKVKLLKAISFGYQSINPDEGVKYGLQGIAIAKKLNWKAGLMLCSSTVGGNYEANGQYSKAMEFYTEALEWAEKSKNKSFVASCYINIGGLKNSQGDYSKALEYYLAVLPIYKEVDSLNMPALLTSIGSVYYMLDNYPNALDYYMQALKQYDKNKNKYGVAMSAVNIGSVYAEYYKDYDKALEYFIKCNNMSNEIGDNLLSLVASANIGEIYADHYKDYNAALSYQYHALELSEKIGIKTYVAMIYRSIGAIYLRIAKSKEGAYNTTKTSWPKMPLGKLPKGKAALLTEAQKYLDLALVESVQMGDLNIMKSCYKELSSLYEWRGDYKKSLAAHKEYLVYKDSIFNDENTAKIAKLEVKAEYEKQQFADSIQNAEAQKLSEMKLQRQKTYTYSGMGVALVLMILAFFIAKERKKSDKLLLNILPKEIAKELKKKGESNAKMFDEVTVLFTDFVGFTRVSERLTPQQLVKELDTCFKAFDNIMDNYSIEKIKTIGDAYLAVCGLPTADEKHAEKVVKAANEIRVFMLNRHAELGDETFEVRIGVHTGEVVAGIVGVKKFAYDIWGDTVNTAARMESNSEAGKINISQTTYNLVQDKFTCTYRGEIEAKGKGMMKMYFVD